MAIFEGVSALLIILITIVLTKYYKRGKQNRSVILKFLKAEDDHKSLPHQYKNFDKKGLYYCNICKGLLGYFWGPTPVECVVCGILLHRYCRNKSGPDCKFVSSFCANKQFNHQWVTGNLAMNSLCSHCGLICAYFYGLEGRSCIWCQRVVHEECKQHFQGQCDLGEYKDIIIPPTLEQICIEPIIVVINKRSGGQSGEDFFRSFNRYLNPLQVINLIDEGCDRLLTFKKISKIIVAGGDGTVGSVINFMKDHDINAPVAILPLGTGNDLSRALGWGGAFESVDASSVLNQVRDNDNINLLDRWEINLRVRQAETNQFMFNYFGIGLDAKFCYDFHNLRIASPELFKSRIGNKFIYTKMGLNDLFKRKAGLGRSIQLECDGNQVVVPDEVENLIVLNINSWSGGVTNLWNEKGEFKPQKINDGLLEVIGITSIVHLGQIQVGISEPYQIAQGRNIRIKYDRTTYIQVDGEPQKVRNCQITIKLNNKIQMLSNIEPSSFEGKLLKTMNWALETGLINNIAKEQILNRVLHQNI